MQSHQCVVCLQFNQHYRAQICVYHFAGQMSCLSDLDGGFMSSNRILGILFLFSILDLSQAYSHDSSLCSICEHSYEAAKRYRQYMEVSAVYACD